MWVGGGLRWAVTLGGNGVESIAWPVDLYPFWSGIQRPDCFRARATSNTPGGPAGSGVNTAAGVTRRAGYVAAPPTSRVAARSLPRRPAAALDPGASTAPDSPTAGAGPRGPDPVGRAAAMREAVSSTVGTRMNADTARRVQVI